MSADSATCEQLESRRFLSISTINLPLPSGDAPAELAAGPHQTMWAIDSQRTSLVCISADGATRRFHFPGRSGLSELTEGPDGNMWFVDSRGGASYVVSRITPKGRVRDFLIPHKLQPSKMVSGPDGDLWLIANPGSTSKADPSLISLTTRGRLTLHNLTLDVSGALSANSLAPGPDNTLYLNLTIPEHGLGEGTWSVIRVSSSGQLLQNVEYSVFDAFPIFQASDGVTWGVLQPSGIFEAAGDLNDANMFYIGDSASTLLQGPENTVWFVGRLGIGYINPDGTATYVPVPGNIFVSTMALGGDENLWISDGKSNTVDIFNTSSSIVASPNPGPVLPGSTQTVTVATFRDFATGAALGRLQAQVDWSDGVSSSESLTENSEGVFTLSATRAFTSLVDAAATVATYTITDTTTGQTATGQASFVNTYPLPVATPINVSAVHGQTFQGHLAQLTGVDLSALANYVISIDWGDGTSGPGTLVADGTGGAYVVGTHQYQHSGTFSINIGVSDPPTGSGATQIKASVTSAATVT